MTEWYEFGANGKDTGEHMDVQGHVLDFIFKLKLVHLIKCTANPEMSEMRKNTSHGDQQKTYLNKIRDIQNIRMELFLSLEKTFNKELIANLPNMQKDVENKLNHSIASFRANESSSQTRSFIGQTEQAALDHDYVAAKYNERASSRERRIKSIHDSLQAELNQAQGRTHLVSPVELPAVVFEAPRISTTSIAK